jgi:predicted anti-sigma-YlaC factor YlaD
MNLQHEPDHDGHASAADLDAARTGEAGPEVLAHLEACEACRRRLRGLEELASMLAGVTSSRTPEIPEGRDRSIRDALRSETGRAGRRGRLVRLLSGAAAAALLLAAGLWALGPFDAAPRPSDREERQLLDVDEDGRVDVIDAYLVARRLHRGETPPASWDVDGDGEVDDADVEAIAQAAVSLGRSR